MTKEEKKIQDALGLVNTYFGFTVICGYAYPNKYKVQDVTIEGARNQLYKIVQRERVKLKKPLELTVVVGEMVQTYNGQRRDVLMCGYKI